MGNKNSIVGIIALIIGASGLGLGAYTMVIGGPPGLPGQDGIDGTDGIDGIDGTDGTDGINGTDGIGGLDGINGTDGIDGLDGLDGINGTDAPGYYCSSQSEIEAALTLIGSGSGKIIITEDITVTSNIEIDGGGHYIIEGASLVTIDCNLGDLNAFKISNATSFIMRDLIFDISDLTGESAVHIDNLDNPTLIENIQIYGEANAKGFMLFSNEITVSNCVFYNLTIGITNSGDYNIITGNHFSYMSNTGIMNLEDRSVISNNILKYCYNGIVDSQTYFSAVSNNVIIYSGHWGIMLNGYETVCTGNSIAWDDTVNNADVYGIYVSSMGGMWCSIVGNVIYGINADGTGTGYGMTIDHDENTVVGNTLFGNDDNTINDNGSNNIIANNNEGL